MIQKENTAKKGDFMSSAYYYLTEDEKDSVGWLGGNAPVWFDGKRDLVDEPGCHYGFYCTFQLKETGRSLSIFLPESFDRLLDDNIYPNCSIKAFAHPTQEESANDHFRLMPEKPKAGERLTGYQKRFDYSRPVLKKVFIAPCAEKPEDDAAFLTIGDDIFYVQDENYYREALIKDGYEIWGYINEDGYYPLARETELIHGNMPLSFGAMYLYKKDNEIIAGCWQYS